VRSVDVSKNIIGVRGIVLFLNECRMYVFLTKTLNSDSVNSDFFHIGQRVRHMLFPPIKIAGASILNLEEVLICPPDV
jgi:hypothetical protein